MLSAQAMKKDCIPSARIPHRLWKPYLVAFFKLLSSFSITKFHCYRVGRETPAVIYAKKFSFSIKEKVFTILVEGVVAAVAGRAAEAILVDRDFLCAAELLEQVKSI